MVELAGRMSAYWRTLVVTARLMVGVKDYERYLARQARASGRPPLSREAFFRHCQEARYGGRGGSGKCPC
ncbi:YbdD/YjiX family protein [Paludibacterium yongneupense]|uniref:YbdD/YjiX family protein n=1 Tax=Paludibacterium yongneupense TaxID=400061 RepID=UPI0004908204|nr:YbdD/YjiX family protein [Paludibacterium yongneupense]